MTRNGHASHQGDEQPLKSWKAIAAYLERDVRTVQRWEHGEGLPVHRHGHGRRASVYAYRSEIAAWLETRRLHSSHGTDRNSRFLMPDRLMLPIAVTTAALLFGLFEWWQLGSAQRLSAGDSAIQVLITDTGNRVGVSAREDVVRSALARTFVDSAQFSVVPQARVDEILALMRRPAGTPIDVETGREIAARDGAIHAVVSANVDILGEAYVLRATVLDSASATVVADISEEATGVEQIPQVAQTLSSQIRREAERSIALLAEPSEQLERVTTNSLDALRLYSRAMAISLEDAPDWSQTAERLLLDAIQYDESFGSALILLAWSIRNQNPASGRYVPYAQRAFSIADDLNDRERYFIRGSYYDLVGDRQLAYDEYSVLVRLYPDHFWGVNNLAMTLNRLGRRDEAARYFAARADLSPTSADNASAAARVLASSGRLAEARKYASRARNLLGDSDAGPTTTYAVLTRTWKAELAEAEAMWKAGNAEGAVQELAGIHSQLEGIEPDERDILSDLLAKLHVAMGRIDEAEAVLEYRSSGPSFIDFLAIPIGAERPSSAIARNGIPPDTAYTNLVFRSIELARTGRVVEARAQLEKANSRRPPRQAEDPFGIQAVIDAHFLVAEGELLRAEGEHEAAEDVLVRALAGDRMLPYAASIAAESVAILRERRGDVAGAIQILEDAGALRSLDELDVGFEAVFWMRNRWQLAELLRDSEPLVAASIESELRALLALADADHPVSLALRQRARSR